MRHLNIREERIQREWTQEYVGNNIGVSKQAIHDIETGKQKPSYDVLLKLENLFGGLSHRYLLAQVGDSSQADCSTPPPAEEDIDLTATRLADMSSTDVVIGARDLRDGIADTEQGKKLRELAKKVVGSAA